MAWDLSMDLMKATVQLEQPLGAGSRTVGTGFLINARTSKGVVFHIQAFEQVLNPI